MPSLEDMLKQAGADIAAGNFSRAEWTLRKLYARHPTSAPVLDLLAAWAMRQGRLDEAISWARRAVGAEPANPDLHFNLALMLAASGQNAEAIRSYQQAIRLGPDRLGAHNNLGNLLRLEGRLTEAAECFDRALSINPTYALSLNNLGLVLLELGRIDDALAQLNKALAANRSFVTAHSNILLAMNSHEGFDRQALFDAHRGFARQQADPLTGPRPALRQRQSGDRIRVGYLSADFRSHSVSFFIDKILANHERASFEISCYSSVARPDAMTQRLAKFAEHWTDIAQLSDDQAAQRIRGDNLDILVELGGHTDSSRLLIAARRPAPVQVSYLGYPNTTGLEQIDYLVTDETLAPVGSDVFYSEKVIRLPRTFFCYFGPEFGLPVSPPPAGKNGYVTFAVLTNWMKVRPMMMELWARILAAVPNSRLLLKAKSLHDANLTNQIREFFSAAGIDPQRILTQSWTQFPEYLRGMSEIDIGLDTFPFNGHTTTCHQLWMGVPLVTLAGQTQASRMGQSILASLDLADLVANTPEQYLEIATTLAHDLERLSSLRASMRQRWQASGLLDGERFTRELESAYRQML